MSRWQDSNLQHPGSKPDALPGYATPRRSIKLCADAPRHCTMCVPRRLRPCVRRPLRPAGDSRTTSPTGRHRGNVLRAATYACLRPDRGVHRLGRRRVSGRRSPASRPASGRTGSGRPARSWNWSVDPWMLLAVVMLLPSRVPLYAVAAHPSSIHRRFFSSTDIVRRAGRGVLIPSAPGRPRTSPTAVGAHRDASGLYVRSWPHHCVRCSG